MTPSQAQVEAGQAVYTKSMLSIYDWLVVRFSNRLIWRCPSKRILALYDRLVTANHLDVGVGTGYFLDHCRFPGSHPRLALMDLNPNCLKTTSRRLARYGPASHRANVLEPIRLDVPRFDSIGLNYLLHCLPGTIGTKGSVFGHLKPLLNPGGVMFGSTLLSGGVQRSRAAQRLMAFYNSKGIFTNHHDDLDGLKAALAEHLTDVQVEVAGCAALFSGRA
jgi:hypothetical protein